MTKSMSKEFGVDNILVNTVCIGSIRSAQNLRRAEAAVAVGEVATVDEYYVERCKTVPVLRVGEAREAGDLIAFLASDRASYISGTAINMDGGAAPVV
jgi:NAD(P)-dependent dehydrogenase (short-subunit alcohol dehydrogenase family)